MPNHKSQVIIWLMFITCSIFYGYEFLLRVSPSIMVSELMKTHDISAAEVGVLSAYYYFTYTPLQLFAGTFVDHYGTKFILGICVLLCIIGTYLFTNSDNLLFAKIGRASIGFGSAFAFVGVLRVCSDWFPGNMFATLAGITTTLGMLGAISGEALLDKAKDSYGLESTFMACCIFGIILLISILTIVESKTKFKVKSNIRSELRSFACHMLFLLKNPVFWQIAIIGLCLFMPTTIFASLWSVKFIHDVYHVAHAANYSSLIFLGWAVGAPTFGLLTKYTNIKQKYILAFGCLMALLNVLILLFFPNNAISILPSIMFAYGFFSSVEILVFDLNHIISGPALCGTAVALTNMVVMLGGFMQPVVGLILDNNNQNFLSDYSLLQYQHALAIIPCAFLLGFILSMLLKSDKIKPPKNLPD